MTKQPHTPTPWSLGDSFSQEDGFPHIAINAKGWDELATVYNLEDGSLEGEYNAQHIVHCVNNWERVLHVLKIVVDDAYYGSPDTGNEEGIDKAVNLLDEFGIQWRSDCHQKQIAEQLENQLDKFSDTLEDLGEG